jgi:hypothetical protein
MKPRCEAKRVEVGHFYLFYGRWGFLEEQAHCLLNPPYAGPGTNGYVRPDALTRILAFCNIHELLVTLWSVDEATIMN